MVLGFRVRVFGMWVLYQYVFRFMVSGPYVYVGFWLLWC